MRFEGLLTLASTLFCLLSTWSGLLFIAYLLLRKHLPDEFEFAVDALADVLDALEINAWIHKQEPRVTTNGLRQVGHLQTLILACLHHVLLGPLQEASSQVHWVEPLAEGHHGTCGHQTLCLLPPLPNAWQLLLLPWKGALEETLDIVDWWVESEIEVKSSLKPLL